MTREHGMKKAPPQTIQYRNPAGPPAAMGVILLTQNTFKRNRDTMPLVLSTGGMTCGTAISERRGTRLWSSSFLLWCGIVITISSFFYAYVCSTIVMYAFFLGTAPQRSNATIELRTVALSGGIAALLPHLGKMVRAILAHIGL